MQISNLPASNSFSSTDVLPIEINGVTYKVTGATLAAALQTLGNYLTTENVANNLTTTAAGSVLDARQGKALADDVGALSSAMTYVVSGNKSIETATIPVGAYVRLVGSTISGRSDGIYTVATAIPVDTVIDGTYFNESAPIRGGGLNALNASMIQYFDYDVKGVNISAGSFSRWGVTDLQPGETSLNKRIGIIVTNTYQAFAALTSDGRFYIYANSDLSNATISVRVFFIP